MLNRPETRNAQDLELLYALDAAYKRAAHDDEIKVIILAANGPHFSSGHDLKRPASEGGITRRRTASLWGGFDGDGVDARFAREYEAYFALTERWRNLPKPTIAEVQGAAIGAALMLVWACDLVLAADDAVFVDNTVAMGVAGTEWLHHPWEIGVRKAKEMLFTGDPISASDAHALGMVNTVVPRADLPRHTLEVATRIARQPMFALRAVKVAVNAVQDGQGRSASLQHAFALHQLTHANNMHRFASSTDPAWRERQ